MKDNLEEEKIKACLFFKKINKINEKLINDKNISDFFESMETILESDQDSIMLLNAIDCDNLVENYDITFRELLISMFALNTFEEG